MAFRNSRDRWGSFTQSLHWLTALLVGVTIPVGWLANSLERGPRERALFDLHFQIGTAILLLLLVRIAWRAIDRPPAASASLPLRVRRAAKVTHLLIYAALFTLVVSGYVIQIHMRPSLEFLGLHIPRPFEPGEDERLRAIAWYAHNYTWWVLAALVLIHAAAALWHHFVKRDEVLERMLPRVRGSLAQHRQEAN